MLLLYVLVDILIVIAVCWPGILMQNIGDNERMWYMAGLKTVPLGIPPGWFAVIWPIMFGCISAAACLFVNGLTLTAEATAPTLAILSLLVINVTFVHMWSILFFTWKAARMAAINTVTILLSAVTIEILLIIYAPLASWVVYLPYAVWCAIAMIVNFYWVFNIDHGKARAFFRELINEFWSSPMGPINSKRGV